MEARRTVTVSAISLFLTGAVVLHAFYQKHQFYPSIVYLTKSNASIAVIYIQAIVLVYLVAQLARKLLFGELRSAESEHLTERTWYAVTETCLAFTVFRDDFSPVFVAHFCLLLVLKCFHWLAEDRVDYMERSPLITALFHVRLMSVIGLLSSFDSFFISHAYFTTLKSGASVQVVFGFEYAILMTIVFHVAIKYVLHTIDSRNVHPWENKAVYLLHAELLINGMRVMLYTVFMIIMLKLRIFPLFSVRPAYLTLKSFKKALNDVFMSRRAIIYLNTLYPNATEAELSQTDSTCIICREEMTHGQAKKLPCNHIFHVSCLRSWFQRQQTCPTCRLDIIRAAATSSSNQQNQLPQIPTQQQGVPNAAFPNANPSSGVPPAPGQPYFPVSAPFHFQPQGNFAAGLFQAPSTSGIQQQQQMPSFTMPGCFPPPFLAPFPPHMMLPFPLPFPSPPNLNALSDDEVRLMEENSRRGVEARIRTLRDIQTLLDAAVVQLQQYLSIMPVLDAQVTGNRYSNIGNLNQASSSAAVAEEFGSKVNESASAKPAFNLGDSCSSEQSTTARHDDVVDGKCENAAHSIIQTDKSLQNIQNASNVVSQRSAEPIDDVREKRLKHFSKTLQTVSNGTESNDQDNDNNQA